MQEIALRLGRWARENRVVFNFRDGNCLYEQTCRKHHQTPTRFSSANSLPDKQFHARVFALHQSERAPRGERFTVLPGKVYFQVFTRAPSLRYTTRHQRTQGQCTRQYPGPATTTHTAERPRRPRSVYTYSARHALATFRLSSSQSAMLTLARLFPATAVPGVRAERAPLKTVCRATGGGRRNNSRSPKTKPQNVAPGRASTKGTPVFAPRRGCVSRLRFEYSIFPDTGARPKRGVRDVCERHASPAVIRMHRQHPRRID